MSQRRSFSRNGNSNQRKSAKGLSNNSSCSSIRKKQETESAELSANNLFSRMVSIENRLKPMKDKIDHSKVVYRKPLTKMSKSNHEVDKQLID